MAINFDLNDLLAFRAVAELSNFRKAAESVHLSQPAFSRRIDKLEQALGVRLLERTTRRVTLTDGRARLRAQGARAARRPRQHAARHPRRGRHAHGRGHRRVRAVDGVLLPLGGHPPLSRAVAEGARQGARCGRQRGARRRQPRRGRLRNQLHGRAGGRPRLQAAGRGALRRGMSPRPPAGEAQARQLGPAGRARLHLGEPDVGQPRCCSTRRWPASRGARRASTRRST